MDALEAADPRRVGRYRITGRLGAGGMGRVFLGRSPSGRLVAVKVVRPELADDPGFRRRFTAEVAAARKVTGFFTAAVVDADLDGSPPWLATAYVPGVPLDQALNVHSAWPVDSVRALGTGVAEALEAIHQARLVHRDLKPSNILIARDGPRVVDFGISVAAEATSQTRTGMVVGTPGYMAPEQLLGKPVTAATNVFALGAVLTYAATGAGPFGTGSAQVLNFRIAYEEPDLAQLPSPGLEIVTRCLAKDPGQRPTVVELIEELAPAHADDGYAPTEVGLENTAWLPGPVARALPATAITPAVTEDGARREAATSGGDEIGLAHSETEDAAVIPHGPTSVAKRPAAHQGTGKADNPRTSVPSQSKRTSAQTSAPAPGATQPGQVEPHWHARRNWNVVIALWIPIIILLQGVFKSYLLSISLLILSPFLLVGVAWHNRVYVYLPLKEDLRKAWATGEWGRYNELKRALPRPLLGKHKNFPYARDW